MSIRSETENILISKKFEFKFQDDLKKFYKNLKIKQNEIKNE